MKRKAILLVLCIVVALSTGCATSPQTHEDTVQAALLVGVSAQETAEAGYSAIRHSWNQGNVSDEDMQKAEEVYLVYEEAHDTYKAVVAAYMAVGAEANLLAASDELVRVVAEMVDLAKQLGVF